MRILGLLFIFSVASTFGITCFQVLDKDRADWLLASPFAPEYQALSQINILFHKHRVVEALVAKLNDPDETQLIDPAVTGINRELLVNFFKTFPRPPVLSIEKGWAEKWLRENTKPRFLRNKKTTISEIVDELFEIQKEISERKNIPLDQVYAHTILKHRGILKIRYDDFMNERLIALNMLEEVVKKPNTDVSFAKAWHKYFWECIHTWSQVVEEDIEEQKVIEADRHRPIPEHSPKVVQRTDFGATPPQRKPRVTEQDLLVLIKKMGGVLHGR